MTRGLNVDAQPKQPQGQIPDCHILELGPRETRSQARPLQLREIALRDPFRRDRLARADQGPADRRDLTRPLTALLALGLGLLGALYVGKRISDSHVIVVPATVNERSVIT